MSAEDNEQYGTDAGYNIRDKVFLLSISETESLFKDDDARICYPTEYTLAQGALTRKETGACVWWLRSPGSFRYFAAFVDSDGTVFSLGLNVCDVNVSVRPAMWINLNQGDDETQQTEAVETPATGDTYTASAKGIGSDVTVTLTIADGKIVDADVDVSGETPGIGADIGDTVRNQLLEAQSADIDGVAGATITSDAVRTAAAEILEIAGFDG